jgi:general secretion pathway protein I
MITWNRRRVKCACVEHAGICRGQTGTAGFTLLEVLVAIAVVAIALVTFMGLHLHSLDDTIRAQDLTTAVLLAQGKMATMGEFPDTGEAEGKFEGPELERFQWGTAVTERTLDATGGGKPVTVRHLEVTVRWVDGQQIRHYTLEAYGVR